MTQLRQTTDGGATWSAMPLPGGQSSLQRNFPAPASAPSASGTTAAPGSLTFVFNGDGFDTCMIGALPSLAEMQTWFSNSPYRVRNLYLGGASLPDCGHLTFSYVQQLAQQGWVFIPTWVGPQPPCANVAHKTSPDPATAYNQGLIEADLALNAAANLGFTRPAIGHDHLLRYRVLPSAARRRPALPARRPVLLSRAGPPACTATAACRAFMASPCGSYIADMSAIPNVPDTFGPPAGPTSYDPNVPI